MRVRIECEESQEVAKAYREIGHEAFSCDLLPCSGGHPEWHIQGDVGVTRHHYGNWDHAISFPPCTDLSVSGARWFEAKRSNGQQAKSILLFLQCWYNSDVTENPIGIMGGDGAYVKKWFPKLYELAIDMGFTFRASQIIQPWQFGHGETKATCLFFNHRKNKLPLLKPTCIVEGREQRIWKLPPSEDRGKLRSKTFPGIAKAMASQWSRHFNLID